MKKLFSLLLLLLFVGAISAGCGYNESILQKADKSYLKFVGNTEQIQITIDDGQPFMPEKNIDIYQISPGKHIIKITRNNTVVVNRIVLLDNKTTMEINVP